MMTNPQSGQPLTEPKVFECNRECNATFQPQCDLNEVNVTREATFSLPPGLNTVDITVDSLLCLFLSDDIVQHIVKCTNHYINFRLSGRQQSEVSASDVLQFFAIIYYLGIVRVPCKYDLWSKHGELPTHSIAVENEMKRDSFETICTSFIDRMVATLP